MRFHTQTAGVSLTAQQPLNNIVRTAIEALAGVLGGTQSLHTNSFDEALALPTEEAVRVALRTQQIIAEETGVANTIDPLGGVVLRRGADRSAWRSRRYEYFAKIDQLGGMVEAVKRGFPQREIADAAFRYQQRGRGGRAQRGRRQRLHRGRRSATPSSCGSTRRSRSSRSSGCGRCASAATGGRRRATLDALVEAAADPGREPDAAAARGGAGATPPRARSSARCRRCSAATAKRRCSELAQAP